MSFFYMLPIIIFSSFFLIFSNQMLTLFIILNNMLFFSLFLNMTLTSWLGYWFLISYNSGILVLLLYLSSMSMFEKTPITFFLLNIMLLFMFIGYNKKMHMWNKFLMNIDETHFFVLDQKNMFLVMMTMILIITVLIIMSKMMNSSKSPSRMM